MLSAEALKALRNELLERGDCFTKGTNREQVRRYLKAQAIEFDVSWVTPTMLKFRLICREIP